MTQTLNTYKILIPYTETANPTKQFKIEYTVEASDRETALKKAEKEFYGYTQYESASWVRSIDKPNIRAWKILPDFPQTVQSIDELAGKLASLDPDTMYNVLKALGELEEAAFAPQVIPLLDHENPDLAALAAECLGKMGNPEALQPLLRKFTPDASPRMRACILSSLARVANASDPIENVVAAALNDPDSRVRANAVELVERLRLSGIARNLVPMLTDEDNRVRANVLKALWHSHNRATLTTSLKDMIGSENRWMRISAAFVLQHIDLEERFALLDRLLQDQEAEVQKSAQNTLFRLNDLACIPLWLNHLATQTTRFDEIADKIAALGDAGLHSLMEYQSAHVERNPMIQQIMRKLGDNMYQKHGFMSWLMFKSKLFLGTGGKTSSKGFTLIEMLIVITIIAILVGAAMPFVQGYLDDSRYSRAKADMDELKTALALYEGRTGKMYTDTSATTLLHLGMLTKNNPDPWGRPYLIDTNQGAIVCAGPDASISTPDDLKVLYQPPLAVVSAFWEDSNHNDAVDSGDRVLLKFTRPLKTSVVFVSLGGGGQVGVTSSIQPDGGGISDTVTNKSFFLSWSTTPNFIVGKDEVQVGNASFFVDGATPPNVCKSTSITIRAR